MCLVWDFLTSKWMAKFTCRSISFLLLILGSIFCFSDVKLNWKYNILYVEILFGKTFTQIFNFWPVIGGIIFVIAIFGIFAIYIESSKLLRWYTILSFLAFVLNAILSGVMVSIGVQSLASSQFVEIMNRYSSSSLNSDYRQKVDTIQSDNKCCGFNGPFDWTDFLNKNRYKIKEFENINNAVPKSCCETVACTSYNEKGCAESIYLIIFVYLIWILIVSSVFNILMLLTVITSFRLKNKVEKAE